MTLEAPVRKPRPPEDSTSDMSPSEEQKEWIERKMKAPASAWRRFD